MTDGLWASRKKILEEKYSQKYALENCYYITITLKQLHYYIILHL